jgi:secreted trypsin-like serine protease
MSAALAVRVLLVMTCIALPVTAWAQGSKRLLAAEKQWDEKVGLDQRIIGGKPVPIKENPWQVGILSARVPSNLVAQFCGGSIISARWVLTAAHCVDNGTQPKQIQILTRTDSLEKGGTRVNVTAIHVHNNWTGRPHEHDFDIAVIEATADLIGTGVVGTAIAGDTSSAEHPTSVMVRVTGWGRSSSSSNAGTKTLQGIEVPYVTRATCNRPASYDGEITA